VNKGGSDNLVVCAIAKNEAESAKKLIENRLKSAAATTRPQSISVADEVKKLAELRRQGLLTDAEFQEQKRKLLA
jgi:hypothetical protein